MTATPARPVLAIKRAIDVSGSLIGLVLLWPLFLAIAVAIKLEDGGPVLYRQARAGAGGRKFDIFKFRSMIVNADAHLDSRGLPSVNRVTRAGTFLRSYGLDELPQLYNVLIGDMSLVGPRPVLPEHAGRYTARQAERFRMRPGITGLAQVKGRNSLKWSQRIKYDNAYIDNYSLRLDAWILMQTVKQVILKKGVVLDRNPGHADDLRGAPGDGDAMRTGAVGIAASSEWDAVVKRCGSWDPYHLSGYHRIAADVDHGEPRLFWFERGRFIACMPYLRREIRAGGFEAAGSFDASSAYGYPGPIASLAGTEGLAQREAFQAQLRAHLQAERIVSVFVRHESRGDHAWLLDGFGETAEVGPTVWIDLAGDAASRTAATSSSHRYELRRAARIGLSVEEATDEASIDEFAAMYLETMGRLDADPYYRFDASYFHRLFEYLRPNVRLFLARNLQGRRVAGALCLQGGQTLHYHLGGRVDGGDSGFATRLVLHEAAERAAAEGKRWFHLGGGLSGRQDGLFRFKAGFSGIRGRFLVSRCIVDPSSYSALCDRRARWLLEANEVESSPGYFPRYRAPTETVAGP